MAAQTSGQPVAEPASSAAKHPHVVLGEANLFLELPKQRLLNRLAVFDTALGKLPRVVAANTTRPEHTVRLIGQHDADAGAISVRIDQTKLHRVTPD